MPTITILPFNTSIPCAVGESILEAVHASRHPLASSCGGEGVCDKCRVLIVEGMEHVSRPQGPELRAMKERPFLPNERMSCQTTITGDISITTTYW
jgi:2Fe-2S ferredoxin